MEQCLAEADQNQHEHHDNEIFECHFSIGDGLWCRQYIVPITLGNRTFEPKLFTTLLTIVLLALLISLGRWQLRRADEKHALWASFAAGTDGSQRIDRSTPKIPRYRHVEAEGRYDQTRQILIDNMFNAEHAGYYVITPFALTGGGWLLVNRGWVPLGAYRETRPAVPVGGEMRRIRGRADNLPAPGIQMGVRAALAPPFPVVAPFPDVAEISQLLHEQNWSLAAETVLLDADQPDGYTRNWLPPGFPPMRHIGYAVQWFGLAVALMVIYVVTNFRRTPKATAQ
jgi:surfeit locus 1 family protein